MIDDNDEAARAYEAAYELEELRALEGLEYLDDDPDAAFSSDYALVKEYEDIRRRSPNDAGWHEHYGQKFMQARMHEEAMAAFRRVVELTPQSAKARYNYGEAIRANAIMKFGGAFDAGFIEAIEPALAQYEAAYQLDPSFSDAKLKLDSVRRDIEIARWNVQREMQMFEQIMSDPTLDNDAQSTRLIEEFGPEGALRIIDRAKAISERKVEAYNEKAEHYEERARRADREAEEALGKQFWKSVKGFFIRK